MKIVYLGSGNAFAPQRDSSCILLDDRILLEAAPNVLGNLKRAAVDPAHVAYIFVSHFHGDHFFGLPFLLLEYHFRSVTKEPLTIVGPKGIEATTARVMEMAFPDVAPRGWPRPMRFVEAEPGERVDLGEIKFSAVAMAHGDGQLVALGYRIEMRDATVAYSGDTTMTDALYELVEGAQVVIVEADSSEESAIHMGRADLREFLGKVSKDSLVFLTHLDTPSAEPWDDFEGVVVPDDLRTFEVLFRRGAPEVRHG